MAVADVTLTLENGTIATVRDGVWSSEDAQLQEMLNGLDADVLRRMAGDDLRYAPDEDAAAAVAARWFFGGTISLPDPDEDGEDGMIY